MTSKHWLRAAALISLLLGSGHMLGRPWLPVADDQGRAVVDAMRFYRFDVMGLSRSYWDFHLGFGWMLAAYLLGHAVLYWQLSGLSVHSWIAARCIVAVLLIESLILTALAWTFLFRIPLMMTAAITLCLAFALVGKQPRVS
jgi:hypothetical protein